MNDSLASRNSLSAPEQLSKSELFMLCLCAATLIAAFWWTGRRMVIRWEKQSGYYSHGWLVPVVTAVWLWSRRKALARCSWRPSRRGFLLLVPSLALHLAGIRMNWGVVSGFAMLGTLVGLVLTLFGSRVLRLTLLPMLFLFFMVPLPESVIDKVSIPLKTVAAIAAKQVVELMGITVIRSGSYLDIASGYPEPVWQRLVVDDVCSGLKFLIALTAFGALYAGAFSRSRRGARIGLFFISMPVALAANVVRVILMVLVAFFWSAEALENDVIHYGLGIVVFMVAYVSLFLVDTVLVRLFGEGRQTGDADADGALESSRRDEAEREAPPIRRTRSLVFALQLTLPLLVLTAGAGIWAARQEQATPFSGALDRIPRTIGEWSGEESPITEHEKRILGTEDVLAIRYVNPRSEQVRLLIVLAQQARRRTHDPQECYTGEGYRAVSSDRVSITVGRGATGIAIPFREVLFTQGDRSRLVWYVFKGGKRYHVSHLRHHLAVALMRLQGRDVADILIRADTPATESDLDRARSVLSGFLSQALPRILAALP